MEYLAVCKVRCKKCGDVLGREYHSSNEPGGPMEYCSCGAIGFYPDPILWKITGNIVDCERLFKKASDQSYKEAYLQYDAESEGVRLDYEDGSSLFLTKDDTFEAFINGDWEYTWIFNCAEGWLVSGVKSNVSLMDGTKVKIRIPK